jgi:hypothetical protein
MNSAPSSLACPETKGVSLEEMQAGNEPSAERH